MTKKLNRHGPFRLVIHGNDRSLNARVIGVMRVPPYLQADVLRLPGESLEALIHRASQLAVGQGVAHTLLLYAGEGRPRASFH